MLDCVCAYALWNGMVRMDTWVARDVWMCAMRVRARACMSAWHACVLCHLCACAHALVYGAHVRGAAPATARDADQAFAVDITCVPACACVWSACDGGCTCQALAIVLTVDMPRARSYILVSGLRVIH